MLNNSGRGAIRAFALDATARGFKMLEGVLAEDAPSVAVVGDSRVYGGSGVVSSELMAVG